MKKSPSINAKAGKQKFNDEIVWELPVSGAGFVVYNRNDVKIDGLDQIGTRETVEAVINIAREWNANHSDQKLQIGDLSRPGGLDTSEHGTHNVGMAFDMRILRKDKAHLGLKLNAATSDHAQYDREATKTFIRTARRLYNETTIYFNDQKIINDAEFRGIVSHSADHWDHLHVMPFLRGRE